MPVYFSVWVVINIPSSSGLNVNSSIPSLSSGCSEAEIKVASSFPDWNEKAVYALSIFISKCSITLSVSHAGKSINTFGVKAVVFPNVIELNGFRLSK
jgi:hypothetical protein